MAEYIVKLNDRTKAEINTIDVKEVIVVDTFNKNELTIIFQNNTSSTYVFWGQRSCEEAYLKLISALNSNPLSNKF